MCVKYGDQSVENESDTDRLCMQVRELCVERYSTFLKKASVKQLLTFCVQIEF